MSNNDEIRWQQRLEHLERATDQLFEALAIPKLSPLERTGMIKHFEMAYELSWKTLKDLLQYEGFEEARSPKSALRIGHEAGYLDDIDRWMKLHDARNLASHTYDEQEAAELAELIRNDFASELRDLADRLRAKADEEA